MACPHGMSSIAWCPPCSEAARIAREEEQRLAYEAEVKRMEQAEAERQKREAAEARRKASDNERRTQLALDEEEARRSVTPIFDDSVLRGSPRHKAMDCPVCSKLVNSLVAISNDSSTTDWVRISNVTVWATQFTEGLDGVSGAVGPNVSFTVNASSSMLCTRVENVLRQHFFGETRRSARTGKLRRGYEDALRFIVEMSGGIFVIK